jgi:CARDB protein
MRRALLIVALAAAALPAAAAAAPPPASVKVTACSVETHEAAFSARMRQLPGGSRMAMRFKLFELTGPHAIRRVKVPGLRRWRSSKPGVRTFSYRQGFRNLPENASHRVVVDFRWLAADGTVIERATRRSARCRQFVRLPNLVAKIQALIPRMPGVVRYEALVRNTGRASASAIPVRLTVDGKVVDTVTIASLAPGERRSVVIRGPECHETVRLEVDPDRSIAESSDLDNAHQLSCTVLR